MKNIIFQLMHARSTRESFMSLRSSLVALSVFGLLLIGIQSDAEASIQLTFTRITSNAGNNVAGQLNVYVLNTGESGPAGTSSGTSIGAGQVGFLFQNSIGTASSITDVYFDDGTLLGIAQPIYQSSGVNFTQNANPGNLPGGNTVSPYPFVTTAGFSADATNANNGVNTSTEWLLVVFNLKDKDGVPGGDTMSFADVQAALALGGADGGLRVGIHVSSIDGANDDSDSFVNNIPSGGGTPGNAVPVPASLGIWGVGVGLALIAGQRFRRKQAA